MEWHLGMESMLWTMCSTQNSPFEEYLHNSSNNNGSEQEQEEIHIEFNSFNDLQTWLEEQNLLLPRENHIKKWGSIDDDYDNNNHHHKNSHHHAYIPSSVRVDFSRSCMLDLVMHRASVHWCCIGFKVAPIPLDAVRRWHSIPIPILYCIAAISMVSLMDGCEQQQQSQKIDPQVAGFTRDVAMELYLRARHAIDDVLFQDELDPMVIQAYFCLSYTSNLLRLYDHQRTWGSLAAIALRQQFPRVVRRRRIMRATVISEQEEDLLLCWYRWYYIDAWMCLTLNRERLLPDDRPLPLPQGSEEKEEGERAFDRQNLYHFAILAHFMRRFINAIRTGALFASPDTTTSQPSLLYYEMTQELQDWYSRLPNDASRLRPSSYNKRMQHPNMDVHLFLCYHAMRLVVLYQFLQADMPPPQAILVDSLETNVHLLQALQHLKDIGCDQSTYHRLFLAIHNTASRVYQYTLQHPGELAYLRPYAADQLSFNITLMQGTVAYANDTFNVRTCVERCQHEFDQLHLGRQQKSLPLPGTFVFRIDHPMTTHNNNTKGIFHVLKPRKKFCSV